jgi:hypothetical protein
MAGPGLSRFCSTQLRAVQEDNGKRPRSLCHNKFTTIANNFIPIIFKYLQGVAYAEDFLFLSDQLMMVPCYSKKIQYEEGAVYKAYITRYKSIILKTFDYPN